MKIEKSIYYLCVLLWLIPNSVIAQFTYIDVGFSQSNLTLNADRKNSVRQVTTLNTTQFHIGGLWRFNRFFGVAIDAGIPIAQKSKFTLKFAEATSPTISVSGNYFDNSTEFRYKPYSFDYTFKQSIQIGFIGRAFFGATNAFIDVRISTLKLKENFVFQRMQHQAINTGYSSEYRPFVKAENINEKHEKLVIIPGFAVGWQPNLGERFFMNFNLAYDFYMLNKSSFSHIVPYRYSYNSSGSSYAEYYVKLESQVTKTKLAITGSVRFGMFF